MEALTKVETNTVIKQTNSIVIKESKNKVIKNRLEMSFKELIKHISKKLMGYAMMLTSKNEDDSWDLMQSTIEKLLKNKHKLMDSDQPMAYAKKILKNNFIDNFRKEKKMVSIEANDIKLTAHGNQEQSVEFQELLDCLEKFDETDKTILAMLGVGNTYEEIQEVIGDISLANLRVKTNRARIRLAKFRGENYE
tara:strand:- start:167 stop:748 length:582 start_codon:yes stop_codon:yes gene_type:complete